MDNYKVILSPTAQRDFMGIAEHLNSLPTEEAKLYVEQILFKAEILLTEPTGCPFIKDSQLRLRGYRVLTIGNHIFLFVISGKTVEVRRVLFAKRKYERLI